MASDILEQIVVDYYIAESGCFVKHNVKYKPDETCRGYNPSKDSVHSDIDVIAINLNKKNFDKVKVISCKSWQAGFCIEHLIKCLRNEKIENKENKKFRELIFPKWIDAFLNTIKKETKQKKFTYVIAVTKLSTKQTNEQNKIINDIVKKRFKERNIDVKIEILELEYLIKSIEERLAGVKNNSVEATSIGRIMQLFKAAQIFNKRCGKYASKSASKKSPKSS